MLLAVIFGIIYLAVYHPESFAYNSGFQVQPEYLTGILSASSILFGLWAIIIERKPEGIFQESTYYKSIPDLFWVSLILLITSVMLVLFTAVELFSSSFTLVVCVLSFVLNAFFLSLALHYYIFRKVSKINSRTERTDQNYERKRRMSEEEKKEERELQISLAGLSADVQANLSIALTFAGILVAYAIGLEQLYLSSPSRLSTLFALVAGIVVIMIIIHFYLNQANKARNDISNLRKKYVT